MKDERQKMGAVVSARTLKARTRNRIIPPLIINLDARWRRMTPFKPERNQSNTRLGETGVDLNLLQNRNIPFPCRDSNAGPSSH